MHINGAYDVLENQRRLMATALCVNHEKNPVNLELVLDMHDNIDFETMLVTSSISSALGNDHDD